MKCKQHSWIGILLLIFPLVAQAEAKNCAEVYKRWAEFKVQVTEGHFLVADAISDIYFAFTDLVSFAQENFDRQDQPLCEEGGLSEESCRPPLSSEQLEIYRGQEAAVTEVHEAAQENANTFDEKANQLDADLKDCLVNNLLQEKMP